MTSTTSAVLEIGGIGFDVGQNTKQTAATVLREYCSCAHARRNTGIPISDNLKRCTQNHDGYFTITSTPLIASTLDPRSSARNPTRALPVHDKAKKPRGQRPALTRYGIEYVCPGRTWCRHGYSWIASTSAIVNRRNSNVELHGGQGLCFGFRERDVGWILFIQFYISNYQSYFEIRNKSADWTAETAEPLTILLVTNSKIMFSMPTDFGHDTLSCHTLKILLLRCAADGAKMKGRAGARITDTMWSARVQPR